MSFHQNNGNCPGCAKIMSRYPGFYLNLGSWFRLFQARYKEAHISCAGRGQQDQEALFMRGVTRAKWGHSAHNYNCAIDIFVNGPTLYPVEWFKQILKPELPNWVTWYGESGSEFYELPHVEIRGWKELARQGQVTLVEKSLIMP